MSDSPSSRQIGGAHYKNFTIQPYHFAMVNELNAFQFAVVKYACRYLNKDGIRDLQKIVHFAELETERLQALQSGEGTMEATSSISDSTQLVGQQEVAVTISDPDARLPTMAEVKSFDEEISAMAKTISSNPMEFLKWEESQTTHIRFAQLVREPNRNNGKVSYPLAYADAVHRAIKFVCGHPDVAEDRQPAEYVAAMNHMGFPYGCYRAKSVYHYLMGFHRLIWQVKPDK